MARSKRGRDAEARPRPNDGGRRLRARQVYIFTEGDVTEPGYIDIIFEHGTPGVPGHRLERHLCNATAKSALRKPLRMVEAGVVRQRDAGKEARSARLTAAAVRVNAGHEGRPDPTTWDPYTDVWEFVESALLIADY